MPTILTHPAVPLAIGLGLGAGVIPVRLLIAGVIVSIVPDTLNNESISNLTMLLFFFD